MLVRGREGKRGNIALALVSKLTASAARTHSPESCSLAGLRHLALDHGSPLGHGDFIVFVLTVRVKQLSVLRHWG